MALVAYNINRTIYGYVQMGTPKQGSYPVVAERVSDVGSKNKPYLKQQNFTQREASVVRFTPGSTSGNIRAIPTVPYYGEQVASNACANFANGQACGNMSQIRVLYEKGVTKNIALTRFVEDMMSDVSTSSLGVSVMEGRDSLQMLGTRFGNLAKAMYQLRKGKVGAAKRSFSAALQVGRYDTVQIAQMRRKQAKYFNDLRRRIPPTRDYVVKRQEIAVDKASSLWLEYWLGWAPFVSDVDKLLDVLADATAKLPSEGVVLKSSAVRSIEIDLSVPTGSYKIMPRCIGTLKHRHTITGRVAVKDPEKFLNRRAGLTNLPAIIWAGVPFSFIIDWFVGVGDVLELSDSFTGITWVNGCYSDTYTLTCQENWQFRESNGGKFDASGSATSSARITRRYLLTAPPTGSAVPRFKDLTQIFEGKEHRAWTSVSLLTQFLISHRNSR